MRLCSGATKRPPIVLPIEARRSAAHSTITYGAEVYPAKLEHGVAAASYFFVSDRVEINPGKNSVDNTSTQTTPVRTTDQQ
jgi:hypothetical protein